MITANLLHLSYNMWRDTEAPEDCPPEKIDIHYAPELRCDRQLWRECLEAMARNAFNMVVIDLGDGVRYESHPEVAVEGAWSPAELEGELAFCRELGLEPIPKLNFSSCHDTWLGEHSRRVSTPEYYAVCRDLIGEVCRLFAGPRLFHVGMDEETFQHQRQQQHVVVRQGDLWWHDLQFLFEEVSSAGSRPWMWSDVLWNCSPDDFERHVPRDVMQSNWYYGTEFDGEERPTAVRAFKWLEQMGYEQIPTGSTWAREENFPLLKKHCRQCISEENLAGYMMADWRIMLPPWRETHLRAIQVVGEARGHRAEASNV